MQSHQSYGRRGYTGRVALAVTVLVGLGLGQTAPGRAATGHPLRVSSLMHTGQVRNIYDTPTPTASSFGYATPTPTASFGYATPTPTASFGYSTPISGYEYGTPTSTPTVDFGYSTPTPTTTVFASVTVTPTQTATVTPTPRPLPTVTATPTPRPIAHPSSVVHHTNGYQVGTYYFSGWSHGQSNNLTSLLASGPLRNREPLVGWYDDTQHAVDANIKQAATAGIDFFAFDWYDTALSPYDTDRTLNEGLTLFMSSSQRYRLNFCLTFIDQKPFLPRAREWPGLVQTWLTYFKQPDYVRVNGKPLFIIFSPENMRTIFGSSANVRAALNYLRARALKAHLPGITIAVGATLTPRYNPARISQLNSEGYNVLTGYNYHGIGGEKYNTPTLYKTLVKENTQMWDRISTHFPQTPYIPVVTSGWDQRLSAREQKTAIIYGGRTADQFACYVASARQWVDMHPTQTVKEKMVLIFAWNEIGEGGSIIPNKLDRYAYTTALNRTFTAHQTPMCP